VVDFASVRIIPMFKKLCCNNLYVCRKLKIGKQKIKRISTFYLKL